MSKREFFGLIATPLVILLIGIAAARIFAPDDLTRQIAIFGAIIAPAKMIYEVWRDERKRRKEEEESKVRLTTTFIEKPHRAVKIVNTSKLPIYLAGVRLTIESGEEAQHIPLQTVISGHCLPREPGQLGEEFWHLSGRAIPNDPLQLGEHCVFVLPRLHEAVVKSVLATGREDGVRIIVSSHTAELSRLEGKELIGFLSALVNDWKKPVPV